MAKRKIKYEGDQSFIDRIKENMGMDIALPVDTLGDKQAFEAGSDNNLGAFDDESTQDRIMRHKNRESKKKEKARKKKDKGKYEIDLPAYKD